MSLDCRALRYFVRGHSVIAVSALLAALLGGSSSWAQSVVRSHVPQVPNLGYGGAVSAAGDVDGDGVNDYVIGSPGYGGTGSPGLEIRSGATGLLIRGILYPVPNESFGASVAGGADFDLDGVPDMVVSAHFGAKAFVYSGASGQQLRVHLGQGVDGFGSGVALLDDMSGDAVPEYGIFASQFGQLVPTYVEVFDGATGLRRFLISETATGLLGTGFGASYVSLGDIDGDLVSDIAIGAPQANPMGVVNGGAVYCFSGVTGALLKTLPGPIAGDMMGLEIVPLGDVDSDGVPDMAVSQFWGGIRAISTQSGVTIAQLVPELFHHTGRVAQALPDLTGDGWPELLVSEFGAPDKAEIVVVDLPKSQYLFRHIEAVGHPFPLPGYPAQLSVIGDIDGDGIDEWVASAAPAEKVEVFTIRSLHAKQATVDSGGGYRVDFECNAGLARAGNQYILLAGATGASPGVQVNNQVLPLNFDFLTDVSIFFANTSPFNSTVGSFDLHGRASAWFDGSVLPPSAVGVGLVFAYYSVGPSGIYVSTNPVVIPVLETP